MNDADGTNTTIAKKIWVEPTLQKLEVEETAFRPAQRGDGGAQADCRLS